MGFLSGTWIQKNIFHPAKVFFIGSVLLILTSCGPKGNKPNVELIQDMLEQPALKAQDFHPQNREKSSMLLPPEGSWPMNRKPYPYRGKGPPVAGSSGFWTPNRVLEADRKFKKTCNDPWDAEFQQLGRTKYNHFCLVCHGATGAGDGPVAHKFQGVKPPSLLEKEVQDHSDAHIFHIITDGQGIMSSYMNQMPKEKDRCAVVKYVRSLQKANKENR